MYYFQNLYVDRCASRVICDEIRLAKYIHTYKEKLACFTRLIPVCISLR